MSGSEFQGEIGQNELNFGATLGAGGHISTINAATAPRSADFMKLSARSMTSPSDTTGYALSLVYQSYRDRLTYLGEGAPEALQLTFRFSGYLGLSGNIQGGPASGAQAQFGIRSSDSFGFMRTTTSSYPSAHREGISVISRYDYSVHSQVYDYTVGGSLDFTNGGVSALNGGMGFMGDYHLTVPRRSNGTYDFGIMTFALNDIIRMAGVSAFVDAGHTVSLSQVKLASGEIVDPSLLSFESGFRFTAVPEPSSLIAGGSAAVILAGVALRRRGR